MTDSGSSTFYAPLRTAPLSETPECGTRRTLLHWQPIVAAIVAGSQSQAAFCWFIDIVDLFDLISIPMSVDDSPPSSYLLTKLHPYLFSLSLPPLFTLLATLGYLSNLCVPVFTSALQIVSFGTDVSDLRVTGHTCSTTRD